MSDSNFTKLAAIDTATLIVGIDIAKKLHWARFIDHRGIEIGKAIKLNNNERWF